MKIKVIGCNFFFKKRNYPVAWVGGSRYNGSVDTSNQYQCTNAEYSTLVNAIDTKINNFTNIIFSSGTISSADGSIVTDANTMSTEMLNVSDYKSEDGHIYIKPTSTGKDILTFAIAFYNNDTFISRTNTYSVACEGFKVVDGATKFRIACQTKNAISNEKATSTFDELFTKYSFVKKSSNSVAANSIKIENKTSNTMFVTATIYNTLGISQDGYIIRLSPVTIESNSVGSIDVSSIDNRKSYALGVQYKNNDVDIAKADTFNILIGEESVMSVVPQY